MSILKKTMLVLLIVPGFFYAESQKSDLSTTNNYHHTSNTTIYTKPAITEKTVIHRVATEHEKKLADAQAQQQLTDMNKPCFQLIGENLEKNMNYLYNAQPFGFEHGLVKGAGIVVGLIGLAYLHKLYADYCFHQSQKSE